MGEAGGQCSVCGRRRRGVVGEGGGGVQGWLGGKKAGEL